MEEVLFMKIQEGTKLLRDLVTRLPED